jgi:hypothetical protein
MNRIKLATCFSAILLLAGCSDATGSGNESSSIDPGRCSQVADFFPKWLRTGDMPIAGADVSCQFVAWLAPVPGSEPGSENQVYVHDLEEDFTFRTTKPDDDGLASIAYRWSPTLHGFWLAYGNDDRIIVENLRGLERAEFVGSPIQGGTVDIFYPWVVWETHTPDGRTEIRAGHVITGDSMVVSPATGSATSPVTDEGRVAYTYYPEDTDGSEDGWSGPSSVMLLTIGFDSEPKVVNDASGNATRPGLYGDLITYILTDEDGIHLVARDSESLSWIAMVNGGLSPESWPRVGHGAVTWLRPENNEVMLTTWWPRNNVLNTSEALPSGSAAHFTIGAYVTGATAVSENGDAIWIDILPGAPSEDL